MKARLQELMALKQLTAAKLANIVGVRPSAVSHILSGRNNPSYDFIFSLLQAYPDISARWLILGEGDAQESCAESPELIMPHCEVTKVTCAGSMETIVNANVVSSKPTKMAVALEETTEQSLDDTQKNLNCRQSQSATLTDLHIDEQISEKKNIEKILMLYDDETFSIYQKR